MTFRPGARAVLALSLGAALTAGCASFRNHQGYLVDEELITAIQPGVDNKDSVEKALGRPSFIGQFTPNSWYYVSRDVSQVAFRNPRRRCSNEERSSRPHCTGRVTVPPAATWTALIHLPAYVSEPVVQTPLTAKSTPRGLVKVTLV